MRTVRSFVVCGLVCILAILVGVSDVSAQWHQGGDAIIDYNSAPPPAPPPVGGNGDDQFNRGMFQGNNAIAFQTTFCCTNPNFCPPNQVVGVYAILFITIVTPNGTMDTLQTPPLWCCTLCCNSAIMVTEAQTTKQGVPAAWNGPATRVNVDAFTGCICCLGGSWNSTSEAADFTGEVPLNPVN